MAPRRLPLGAALIETRALVQPVFTLLIVHYGEMGGLWWAEPKDLLKMQCGACAPGASYGH